MKNKGRLALGVVRIVARFPLDAAAHAGLLILGEGPTRKGGNQGCAKVLSGHWNVALWTAVVVLPPVDELALLIEPILSLPRRYANFACDINQSIIFHFDAFYL